MAEPNESIAEQIAENIVTTLSQIRRNDGYWYDVDEHSVTREDKTVEQITDSEMPFYMVLMGDSDIETIIMPKKAEEELEIMIDGLVKEPDERNKETARERAIRDVKKKLQVDTTRATLAWHTKIEKVERFGSALGYDDFIAFRVTLRVFYRYVWTVP